VSDPKQPEDQQEPESEPGQDASRQAPEPPKPNTTGKKDWH
jgi:hypothetical protein